MQELGEGLWRLDGERPGARVVVSFGVHGNERAPIEAGLELAGALERGALALERGSLLLVHANPRASAQDERWSAGGVDLNRCFQADVLARAPELYEEARARAIADALEAFGAEILVDFHCTVEPGRRFLMQHPPPGDAAHRAVSELLAAEVLLADPALTFGGVSLDEWMTTRGRVGICYETGWKDDPANTPAAVRAEMENLLVGLGLLAGRARRHAAKRLLVLEGSLACEGAGFAWEEGVGQNLQELPAGALLGRYQDGRPLHLGSAATLVFPKKRPELVQPGKPLVLLARAEPPADRSASR